MRYINYLDAALMVCEDYGEYVNFLQQHKEFVEKGLKDNESSSSKVRRKYNWLRNYHNEQVRVETEKREPRGWKEEYDCILHHVSEGLLVK